jgi:hypothetical protein
LFCASGIHAQLSYTVKLKYKKSDTYSLNQPSAFLSQKAIQRRIKQHIALDSTDLPINADYTSAIANVSGVKIVCRSKWLNQVAVELTDPNAITTINSFPFVEHTHIAAVALRLPGNPVVIEKDKPAIAPPPPIKSRSVTDVQGSGDTLDYGNSFDQVHIHEGEYLHQKGFQGQGITIAVIDAGFYNYQNSIAFDSVRTNNQILGTYDFVMDDSSVNEDNAHGSYCFSILAANRPGLMVGTAPKAKYWLFRSEDVTMEKPVEELNWIEALEKADSLGADMISSSLGYYNFEDPQFDHSYAQRDGNTTQITIAADLAAKKGMIVMNAAGNTGNAADESKYILCPADGDSVMTVGAVNTSGLIAGFSSWGPNGAQKRKPNIVSVGWGATYANMFGTITTGNGTSYANPNVAGLIACLWQAFPEFSNMEILDAVERSSSMYNNPDDRYGYGIPNFRSAYQLLAAQKEENDSLANGKWLKAFPIPFRQFFTVFLKAPATGHATLRVIDLNGHILAEKTVDVTKGSNYNIKMNPAGTKRFGVYILQYSDGKNSSTVKMVAL